MDADWPLAQQPEFEIPERQFDVYGILLSLTTNAEERRAVDLWINGGAHEDIAVALGASVSGYNLVERRREGKRLVDRIIKRASRYVRDKNPYG
jgi:hypothetical protein